MSQKTPAYKYKRVLLLDDDELDNFINKKIIETSFFADKVYINSSGSNALEFLMNIEKTGLNDIEPQILFIDINMPIMDGFQFLEFFIKKSEHPELRSKVVILTSSVNVEDRSRFTQISPDIVFLNKPLTESMLHKL